MIGMVGFENFTISHSRGPFWAAGNDGAVLFLDPRFVVDGCSGFQCLTLEPLVDGVGRGPSLNNSIRNTWRFGLRDDVVRVNQIHRIERGGLERGGIQPPLSKLFKEIIVHAPVFKGLEIAIKSSTGILANVMNMHLSSCLRKHDGGRKA